MPDLNRWFEVKGKEPSQEELEKCRALAIETGSEVLLAAGSPDPDVEQIIRVYPGFDAHDLSAHLMSYLDNRPARKMA